MTFESNGPEGKVRGNATQVHEKYLSLAREAASSGNRIMAETFFQHAEHYYRVLNDSTDPRPEGAPAAQPGGSERAGDGRGARRNGGYEGPRPAPAGDGADAGPRAQEGLDGAPQPDVPSAAPADGVQPVVEQPSLLAEQPDEAPAVTDGGSKPRRGRPRSKTTDGDASPEAPPRRGRGRPRRDASPAPVADKPAATSSGDDADTVEDGPSPDKASA